MWVRGLKLRGLVSKQQQKVAPYVGAWIETHRMSRTQRRRQSHPMWVRGLKQPPWEACVLMCESHPMWVRGLKHLQ